MNAYRWQYKIQVRDHSRGVHRLKIHRLKVFRLAFKSTLSFQSSLAVPCIFRFLGHIPVWVISSNEVSSFSNSFKVRFKSTSIFALRIWLSSIWLYILVLGHRITKVTVAPNSPSKCYMSEPFIRKLRTPWILHNVCKIPSAGAVANESGCVLFNINFVYVFHIYQLSFSSILIKLRRSLYYIHCFKINVLLF